MDLLAEFASAAPPRVRVGWRTNRKPMYEFDIPAIERACDHLGVTRRVVVGAVNARRRWVGMHHERDANDPDAHRVTCKVAQTLEEASRTLWHELSHAAQSDRGVKGGTSQLRGREYDEDPREIEARAAERNHELVGALVVQAWWDGEGV